MNEIDTTDAAFDELLRSTLAEMIPQLLAQPGLRVGDQPTPPAIEVEPTRVGRGRAPRRAAAALLVAASVAGLVAVVNRSSSDTASSTSTVETTTVQATPPAWFADIRALVPPRFAHIALKFADVNRLEFIAIDLDDGLALEVSIDQVGDPLDGVSDVDLTGSWLETVEGWNLLQVDGTRIDVSCDAGIPGGESVDRCGLAPASPFTKAQRRALAAELTTANSLELLAPTIGGVTQRQSDQTDLIAEAVPKQAFIYSGDNGHGEWRWAFGGDINRSPDTAVRLVTALYPPLPITSAPAVLEFGGVATFWISRGGGNAVQLRTTDVSPASIDRLTQLGFDLLAVKPVSTTKSGPQPTTSPTLSSVTTTIAPAPLQLLPTVMPEGLSDVADWFTTETDGPGPGDVAAPWRLFVGQGPKPAVLLVGQPEATNPMSEFEPGVIQDFIGSGGRDSWAAAKKFPSGNYVFFRSGGMSKTDLQAVIDSAQEEPSSGTVQLDVPPGFEQIHWDYVPAARFTASWTSEPVHLELVVGPSYGLNALTSALSSPMDVIETDKGLLYITPDPTDPTYFQASIFIDGTPVNLTYSNMGYIQIVEVVESIQLISDEEWARRVLLAAD